MCAAVPQTLVTLDPVAAAAVAKLRHVSDDAPGITLQAGPALSLYATYDAVLPTANTTDQTVQAGLRLRF